MPSCPEVALCVALSDLVQHRGGHRRVRHGMAWQGRVECSIAVFQDSEIAGSVVISAERSRVDTFRASSTKTWAISGLLLLGLFRVNLWRDVHTSLTCRSVQRYASRGEDHPTLPATTPKNHWRKLADFFWDDFENLHGHAKSQAARGTFAVVGQVTSTRRRSSNSNKMA